MLLIILIGLMYFSPVVDCGNPTDLANGNVTFEETTFGQIIIKMYLINISTTKTTKYYYYIYVLWSMFPKRQCFPEN